MNLKSISAIAEQNLIRLGKDIKKARVDKGMSLRELSAISGINHKTIFSIETAKTKRIDPNILVRLSSILKLDLPKMLVLAGYFELVFRLKYENIDKQL